MLIAYDADGNIVGTLDMLVAHDANGHATGLVDFAAHEAAGGRLRDIWQVATAAGSGVWPEWLGGSVHDFRVELDSRKRIVALVHRVSGHRRERAAILAAIEAAPTVDGVRDLRAIVGGPTRPLTLDQEGHTAERRPMGTLDHLPLVGATRATPGLP